MNLESQRFRAVASNMETKTSTREHKMYKVITRLDYKTTQKTQHFVNFSGFFWKVTIALPLRFKKMIK